MKRILYTFFLAAMISSCQNKIPKEKAEILYFGGPILTMEDSFPQVEAVAVKDGKILFAGKKTDAERFSEPATKMIHLNGKTLLPGFIDVHGHLTSRAGTMDAVDLSPEPYGTVNSIQDLQIAIRSYIKDHKITDKQPIIGNGYDDAIMTEHRHPTKTELDAISKTNPIIVIHASGHASVANSAMLQLLGITETSKDPEGGHIGRDKKQGN